MSLSPIIKTSLVIIAVVLLSTISTKLWGEKPEVIKDYDINIPTNNLTIAQVAELNSIPVKPIAKALDVNENTVNNITLADLKLTPEQARQKIKRLLIQYQEGQSKNWQKIFIKFILWFIILAVPFVLLFRGKITPKKRKYLLALSVLIFGIALGSDPSPMGTVKDAVFLLTVHQTVFWPRIIALGIFLGLVVIANKFICSWGCQFGVLQDLIFRFGRNKKDCRGILKQYKPPFWLTNSIRVLTFVVFAIIAMLLSFDIIGYVDPFKIYNPAHLVLLAIIFIALILALSLIIYRPWCHLFCPFGLVAWLFEKISIFRIKVDYDKCIACDACAKFCPSTVMSAILKRDKRTIPDCFTCGNCIESCPTSAITLSKSRIETGNWQEALERKKQRRLAGKSEKEG